MPRKTYIVDLTQDERTHLLDFIENGKRSARKLDRARILLLADEGKTDGEIAKALHTGVSTVQLLATSSSASIQPYQNHLEKVLGRMSDLPREESAMAIYKIRQEKSTP